MNDTTTSNNSPGSGSPGANDTTKGGAPGTTNNGSDPGTNTPGNTPGSDSGSAGGGKKPSLAAGGETTKTEEGDKTGAPETYEKFNLPEGFSLADETLAEFSTVAKDLNLSQEGAQSLVDMHTKLLQAHQQGQEQYWQDAQEEWVQELRDDPTFGPKFDKNITDIGKMWNTLPPDIAKGVKDGLNFTGAGNHPGVVKALALIAAKFTEGKHVGGGPPSKKAPASIAAAMYPHLVNQQG